jgi:hypothetical protein
MKQKRKYKKNPLRNFLFKICRQYDIQIRYIFTPRTGNLKNYPLWASSQAETFAKIIEIPKLQGDDQDAILAAALHEIGHCIDFHSKSWDDQNTHTEKYSTCQRYHIVNKSVLLNEIAAWQIAKTLGISIWTERMQYVLTYTLSDWTTKYNTFHKRKMSIPLILYKNLPPLKIIPPKFFDPPTTPIQNPHPLKGLN